MKNTTTATKKHDLEWFINRVGSFIYRGPFFPSEAGRPYVAIKIQSKGHANQLFELQSPSRPRFESSADQVQTKK